MAARVLVVDDNATNRDLALYLLRSFGYEAEGAPDGLAGLEAARTGRFDLVLLDMLMPGIDGYEFARRFRSDAGIRQTPVVAVTALAMAGDRERILAAGIDGYISKPIEPRSFVEQIERYLAAAKRSDPPSSPVEGAAAGPVAEADGPVVLVVDDVLENLAFVRAALAPFGYRIVDANSVDEAMVMLERVRPAVVICDLHMPRRDGFDLLEHLGPGNRVPFVFLSSTGWRPSDRLRGERSGAAAFLERPIAPERLRQEVERALNETHGDDSHRR